MNNLGQVAKALNLSLIEYTDIHDEIFKRSLRKLIPLPFIFKRIDFLKHRDELNGILSSFTNYKTTVDDFIREGIEEENKCRIFFEYLKRLEYAVKLLAEISHNLYLKSQAKNSINYKEHSQLCDKYDAAVNSYVNMGDEMNSIFA